MTVCFPSYGEMRGLHLLHYRDDGTWRVTEDGFCGEWNNWLGTMAQCWRAYRSGDAVNLEKVFDSRASSYGGAVQNADGRGAACETSPSFPRTRKSGGKS